jgi:hypothetical protein
VAVNLIVLAVTLLLVGFLIAWVCFPRLRRWIEAPKYRVLQWPNRYPEAARPEPKPGGQRDRSRAESDLDLMPGGDPHS